MSVGRVQVSVCQQGGARWVFRSAGRSQVSV